MSPAELSVVFFLQMFVILVACRLAGAAVRFLGQPQVMGEMIAGVLLGPSLAGLLLPEWQARLFPGESLRVLFVVAQLGIGLYMFLVGVELKTEILRARIRSAASVSIAGMLVPFAIGGGIAFWLKARPGFFAAEATSLEAMLFLGAAMAITAFPVLARILDERGLTGTPLGTIALAAGAINDALAWCILAIVLASFGGGPMIAARAIGGGFLYVVFLLTAGRLLLRGLGRQAEETGRLTPQLLAITLMLFVLGAWAMDAVGLHAVFGGFIMGVAMPRGLFAREVKRQLEPFAVAFLVPVFFTYSGLNTRLDLVNSLPLLGIAVIALAGACLGKLGACWAAARWNGEDNRTALAVGALMNARGLMELIILNIGLQRGLIGAQLFSVMVLMAIVTTFMASPLLEWVYGRHARRAGVLGVAPEDG